MKKPTIHIGSGPYSGPPTLGNTVMCGKTAGTCIGILETESFLNPFRTKTYYDATYNVHFTRTGLEHVYKNHSKVAARSCKMYGYYNTELEGHEFYVCKACLDSEDFGLLALKVL